MVQFETQVYHKEGTDIVGAEVIVSAENGERIGTLQITSKTDFDDLVSRLDNLAQDFISFAENSSLAGMTIDEVLTNLNGTATINATKLGGYTASQYALTNHTHNKASINDLYDIDISSSSQNPNVNDTITITVTVKNTSAQSVSGKSIIVYKNGVSWRSGTTNTNGVFSTTWTVDSDAPIVFKVDDEKLIVTPKPYWANVTVPVGTLKVCETLRLAEFSYNVTGATVSSSKTYLNNNNAVIPSDFRPSKILSTLIQSDLTNPKIMMIESSGKIFTRAKSSSTNETLAGYFIWHY